MENNKLVYSMKEAAEAIGVSIAQMYKIAKREDCDFIARIGGRTLVSRARLEAWLDRQIAKVG